MRNGCDAEYPQMYVYSLVIEKDSPFFFAVVCCFLQTSPFAAIEQSNSEYRNGSSSTRHNAGTEKKKKCNYFNSVIRRVKCEDIVKLYEMCVGVDVVRCAAVPF